MENECSGTDQPRLPPELWFLIFRYVTYPPFPWSPTTTTTTTTTCSASQPSDYYYQITTTLPFHIRLTNYTSELKWKASLTCVCKEWNLWGQEFLWEHIWIASGNDAKFLVGLVGGQSGQKEEGSVDALTTRVVAKQKQRKVGFALKPLKRARDSPPCSKSPVSPTTTTPLPSQRKNIAPYIKKLHIETPSMDRCCLIDLMSILKRCERLEVLIDLRSIRTGFGFVGVGAGRPPGLLDGKEPPVKPNTPKYSERPGHHCITSGPILQALPQHQSTLKHLTFTNYKHNLDDPRGGVAFWQDVVGRVLTTDDGGLGATLESLEVVMSTRGVGMRFNDFPGSNALSRRLDAGLLTSLDIQSLFPSTSNHNPPSSLSLPSLHSLRIPLTSPTLLVISTWALPSLQSLCVVSIDFTGWRRMGLKELMDVHGSGLIRFEIIGGGESGEEEGWITEREHGIPSNLRQQQHLHLPSTSPRLKHFICSSSALEWNWETPDWIAPHVLMPEHFGVERIGVWGLEGKVARGGGAEYDGLTVPNVGGRRRTRHSWTTSHSNDFSSTQDEEHLLEEQPFFMLQEQFGSLLRREAFPALVCIRDMSWESDLIRRSVGVGCDLVSSPSESDAIPNASTKKKKQKGLKSLASSVASRFRPNSTSSSSSSCSSSSSSTPPTTLATSEIQAQSYKIRKFWLGILEMCDRRGVYLEDWMGKRVVA